MVKQTWRGSTTWQRSHNLDVEELGFETRSSDTNINKNSNFNINLTLVFTTLEFLAFPVY